MKVKLLKYPFLKKPTIKIACPAPHVTNSSTAYRVNRFQCPTIPKRTQPLAFHSLKQSNADVVSHQHPTSAMNELHTLHPLIQTSSLSKSNLLLHYLLPTQPQKYYLTIRVLTIRAMWGFELVATLSINIHVSAQLWAFMLYKIPKFKRNMIIYLSRFSHLYWPVWFLGATNFHYSTTMISNMCIGSSIQQTL